MSKTMFPIVLALTTFLSSTACSRKANTATQKKKADSSAAGGIGSSEGDGRGAANTADNPDNNSPSPTATAPIYRGYPSATPFPGSNYPFPTLFPTPTLPGYNQLDATQLTAKLTSVAPGTTNERIMITWRKLKDVPTGTKASYTATFSATDINSGKVQFRPKLTVKYKNATAKNCELIVSDITSTISLPQSARCEG